MSAAMGDRDMTYTPTDEQIEALAIKEFEKRGPDGPYGLPWKKAPKLDKDDYRRSARAHVASPEMQAIIRAAQADAWGQGYDVGVAWEPDMNSRTIPLADKRDNPYLEVS